MERQNPVSLQIPIIQGKEDALAKLLNNGGKGNPQITEEGVFPFKKIPTVHFGRWLVIPPMDGYPPSLIYAVNVDGNKAQHFVDIVTILPDGLDTILSHCVDYPSTEERNKESRINYLKKYEIGTPGYYVGAPNRTVEQIHNEARLHNAVRDFVRENSVNWTTNHQAYEAIQGFLANDPQWDWARKKYHLPRKGYLQMFFLLLFILAILPLFLLFLVLIHFFYEKRAEPFGKSVNAVSLDHLAKLQDQEDIIYQNQMSQVFNMKGGLRKLGLHFFLWNTSLLAKYWFVGGQLLGTPTIHFARWVIIDKGKRFVFFSNFDGSFDEYLGDFVDHSGWGLNAIYGASKGYPRTLFVFGKGAYIISEFMGWGRLTQIPTSIWYSAYPWYGLQQIVDRSKLRVELFNSGSLNEKQIKEMLRRI